MATPQVLSRKANGVASTASSQNPADAPKPTKTKTPIEGEKVVIRRLPPGMTEDEFSKIMGDAWKSGNGKVGWFQYHPGKISRDPAKPSRPSRAYLHVLRRDELLALSDAVRTASWEDARESWNDPALVGPPTVEHCIYKKMPSGKRRTDGRQGTIDQDREFMAFLESLANPDAHKDGTGEGEQSADDGAKPEKAITTPLIEFLKEKKANKAKEAAAAKSAKHSRQESQGGGKTKGSAEESSKKKSKGDKSSDKPKETVKILTKKAAAATSEGAASATDSGKASTAAQSSGSQDLPRSRRAGIAAAARILQRDLGLSPGNAHRKARQEAAKAEAEAKLAAAAADKDAAGSSSSAQAPASPTTGRPSTPTAPKAQAQQASSSSGRTRGKKRGNAEDSAKGGKGEKSTAEGSSTPAKAPVVLLKKKDETNSQQSGRASASASTPSAPPTPTGPKAGGSKSSQQAQGSSKKSNAGGGGGNTATPATPSPGATRAFVKHANPSQGVTEPLLKEAMQVFGAVTFVEIDRRKGFAYVDFAEPEGLVRAIAANPVNIAQAAVQILERRDKETPAGRRGGGGKNAANGGAAGNSKGDVGASATPAGPASAPAGPAAETDKAPATAAAGAATTEKRGGRRRGGRGRDRDKDGGATKNAGKGGASGGNGGGGGGGSSAAAAAAT